MSNARARLLRIRAYLLEQTDAQHPVSLPVLCATLEREGLEADTRAVLADLEALRASGLNVCTISGRTREFYLGGRMFTRAELRLLMDMVRANRFLPREQTDALLDKCAGLASRHERTSLAAPCGAPAFHPTEDEDALLAAERILLALRGGRRLSFLYCAYGANRALQPRRGGQAYVVNPCTLLYAEERYYLVGDHPAHEGLAHYRLDRMRQVRVLEEPAAPPDVSFDPMAYARSVFSMYPAELRWVRLAFDRSLIGAMLDRFGPEVPMEQSEGTTFVLSAPVCIGAPFFGWVFSFCGAVRILAPDDVRERMLLMLEANRTARPTLRL